jgi:hypothetical protein
VTAQRRRPIPADMLLVEERRRRMMSAPSADRVERSASLVLDVTADEILAHDDDDQLVENEMTAAPPSTTAPGDAVLRRPMAHVSLVRVGWSGPIDHDALAEALLCSPADDADFAAQAGLFEAMPFAPADGGAALEVTLGPGDIALLRSLCASGTRGRGEQILRAARLPDRLSGAEPATAHAASAVLAAYRHASLEHSWHRHLHRAESAQVHRERDEAAVAVLSTLRALLGER